MRDTIEEFLRLELIGPVSEDETLRDRPDTVYSLGVLWPQRHRLEGTVKADDAVDLLINEVCTVMRLILNCQTLLFLIWRKT